MEREAVCGVSGGTVPLALEQLPDDGIRRGKRPGGPGGEPNAMPGQRIGAQRVLPGAQRVLLRKEGIGRWTLLLGGCARSTEGQAQQDHDGGRLASPFPDHATDEDPHLVEQDDGSHHHQHREHVRRRDERGDHRAYQERVGTVFGKEPGAHQPHRSQQHHHQRQLKNQSEAEKHLRREAEILSGGDERLEGRAHEALAQHDPQDRREHPEEGHPHTGEKQSQAGQHGGHDHAALALVERRSEETPHLSEDDREGDNRPYKHREFQRDEKGVGRAQKSQPVTGQVRLDRLHEQGGDVEASDEIEPDD